MDAPKTLWSSSEIRERMREYAQELNPNSAFAGAALSRLAGLKRAQVSIARILEYPKLGKRYLLEASPTGTKFYELGAATTPFGPARQK